jgi:two-component system phosphate regulon sensor histidine kinase PhoR
MPVGVAAGLISAVQSGLLADWNPGTMALWAAASALLAVLATYASIHLLNFRRLEFINSVIRDIQKKQFGERTALPAKQRDEIDHLVRQSIRASETVEREIARLNKIENYRKEFIGDISHELKTPIFAIQGFIETLLNGALDDKSVRVKFLEKAMKNTNRLILLIQDLIDISRLESGDLRSNVKPVHIRDLITEVVDSLQEEAGKEDIQVICKPFDRNLKVLADPQQLRQVLVNLIENGIKYNRHGGTVEIGLRPFPKKSEKVLLFVKDTGIGLEQRDVQRVTERFFRVDKSRSREKGGTGLGLSIVKHIMNAHGENLYIDSQIGQGSTFSITLARQGEVKIDSLEQEEHEVRSPVEFV